MQEDKTMFGKENKNFSYRRALKSARFSRLFLPCVIALAQKIHKNEDAEALFCYKHVVQSVFAERRKASACPTITQHSVCCFPRYSPSPWWPVLISYRAVPMAGPSC